jgi:hypothetical protein
MSGQPSDEGVEQSRRRRVALGDALRRRLTMDHGMMGCRGLAVYVELENSGNHDHGARAPSLLEHCEFQGRGAIGEQAATKASLVLNDPIAASVFADQERR